MNSAGSRDRPTRWLWMLALGLGASGLVCAAAVVLPAAVMLAAIVFPPDPPVPQGAVLVSHTSAAHGVDTWHYRINRSPCDTVAFFEERGGTCIVRAGWCTGGDPGLLELSVAHCSGDVTFSSFTQRWLARISVGAAGDVTDLTLSREVSWLGALPPATLPPL